MESNAWKEEFDNRTPSDNQQTDSGDERAAEDALETGIDRIEVLVIRMKSEIGLPAQDCAPCPAD